MIFLKKTIINVQYICKSYFCNAAKHLMQAHHVKSVGETKSWIPVIGLEIHAQILTKSKLFSGAPNIFMAPPNSVVSNFDASMPGTLPVLNYACVEKAVITALALNCRINHRSYFDRKHYFYADMPQGYQITQQRQPIAVHGHLNFPTRDGSETKHVNIQQIQLEQDSGKSLHDKNFSYIDLNRAGVGLIEIVTGPDLHSADDTVAFVQELYLMLKRLGTCDGKLAEGKFRVDVNISLKTAEGKLGNRIEVKNISGFSTIHQVVEYEIQRQSEILEEGGLIEQETRGFDVDFGTTMPMRDKEVKQDYRFMPEPNLPPLVIYDDETIKSAKNPSQVLNVDDLRRNLPTIPADTRNKLIEKYQVDFKEAMFIVEREMDKFFISVMERAPQLSARKVVEWCRIHIIGYLYENDLDSIKDFPMKPEDLADLLVLEHNFEINHSTALDALNEAIKCGSTPVAVVEQNDWKMISDVRQITEICKSAIRSLDESDIFARYKPGNPSDKKNRRIIKKVIDLVRERTDNKAHTKISKNVIITLLDERSKNLDS